jgi:hypothetical protein
VAASSSFPMHFRLLPGRQQGLRVEEIGKGEKAPLLHPGTSDLVSCRILFCKPTFHDRAEVQFTVGISRVASLDRVMIASDPDGSVAVPVPYCQMKLSLQRRCRSLPASFLCRRPAGFLDCGFRIAECGLGNRAAELIICNKMTDS